MFGQKLFGAKSFVQETIFGRAQNANHPEKTFVPEGRRWTFEELERLIEPSLEGKNLDSHSWYRSFGSYLTNFTAQERADVLVSLAPMADELNSKPTYPPDHTSQIERARHCFDQLLRLKVELRPDQLADYVTLVTSIIRVTISEYQAKPILNEIKAVIARGGFLTTTEITKLSAYASELRKAGDKKYGKPDKKTYIALATTLEKMIGAEQSSLSALLDRSEPADTGYNFDTLPENYDFWCRLFSATATALHDIGADLKKKTKVAWLHDEKAFAVAFPAVGPFTPQFALWNEYEHERFKNFSLFRELLGTPKRLAEPSLFLELCGKRKKFENSVRYFWHSPAIPALEKLGNLERAEDTALLEQLITAKDGTRPIGKWMKATVALVDVIGRKKVERRLHEWLGVFHDPIINRDVFGEAQNCFNVEYIISKCNTTFSDWPKLIEPAAINTAGRALALELASGKRADRFSSTISLDLFKYRIIHAAKKSKMSTALDLYVKAKIMNGPNRGDYNVGFVSWQSASVENEQMLRSCVWLLKEMPDQLTAISTLEKMSLAGACGFQIGRENYRAHTVANAAIASLIDIGTGDAQLALLRLSREIDDASMVATIVKALNQPNSDQTTSS
jgi:hypothetical protein